jgi:type IV pilus assembly protein PilF
MKLRYLAFLLFCFGLAGCSNNAPKDPNGRSAAELYREKGVRYMEMGELEYARQDLEHAADLDDSDSETQNALAVLYGRMEQVELADKHFRRALALDESNASAVNNYARFLCAHGKYEDAMAHFRKLIDSKLYKSPWLALTNAGLCASGVGRLDEAEELLRKALEEAPTFPPALLEMVKISLQTGRQMSARGFLQRFEGASNPSPESLSLGEEVEQALGNPQGAEAYRKQLQSKFPDSPAARRERSHRVAPY